MAHHALIRWLIIILVCVCLVTTQTALAEGSVQDNSVGWSVPLATGLSAQCTMFMVIGVCVWIICTNLLAVISISPFGIGHYNPEALVEVSNPQGIERVEDPKTESTPRIAITTTWSIRMRFRWGIH